MNKRRAILRSKIEPSPEQKNKILGFLEDRYDDPFEIVWHEDETLRHGFVLRVGSEVYDWSAMGRIEQLQEQIEQLVLEDDNVISLLRDTVHNWSPRVFSKERGIVERIGDGIATVIGLENVTYGEILLFTGGIRGLVLDIRREEVGCILFGEDTQIAEGSSVYRTMRTAGIPVSQHVLGRVVNAIGAPIDEKGEITAGNHYPIEKAAPTILDRQPVFKPLETGILAIDSMFPIGRGQRELIIGDRQTGKTAIALDTILNQKGKNVICIYVAIGQKASSVARLVEGLRKHNAMDYTVVVCATASDSAALQYIAPYAGTAIGEYFMDLGKDVLMVYDDLSKHAIAYRSISLLLERSPGREAYPGDVFYLHSRLLERSCQLSEEKGGGSITALPIVETQAGDISAYIPTNIISITDGQIFLESELFFAGQRPAINAGLSVSRVGGAAQTQAIKSASGTFRLDLAQYREMEIFTQFASDLDDVTKRQLVYGQGLMQMLRQSQSSPLRRNEQVIMLLVALNKKLLDVPISEIRSKMKKIIEYIETKAPYIVAEIETKGLLSKEDRDRILELASEYIDPASAKRKV